MIRLEMKSYNATLMENQQKYLHYHLEKLIKVIEQAKFTYSILGKALEKQLKTIEDQG